MKDSIFCICLGNNCGNLNGSKNDSIIFYNYISNLSENDKLKEKWLKPNILFDSNVAVNNIKNLINKNSFSKLLIYYSGHGYSNGNLNIYDSNNCIINYNSLIREINSVLKNDIELYIILDSCYSGCTNTVPFQRIKKINILTSSNCKQTSSESITGINNLPLKIKYHIADLSITKKNLVVGVFTFNLVEQLVKLNIKEISNFKDVFKINKETWETIRIISKQFPKIIWN
tara:strand:- start:506 stop:1195 length:690 start_codon:yes stop_codon:yes gene_type:complete